MIIASATRSDNDLLTGPGITVRDGEPPYADLAEWAAEGTELDGPDGWLNEEVADQVLRELGFHRTEPWRRSDGQWTATVEPI